MAIKKNTDMVSSEETPKGSLKTKVFADTDVVLDLLTARMPHHHFACVFFTLAEMQKFSVYVTPQILSNTFYILRKTLGNEKAKETLRKFRTIVHCIDASEKAVDKALNSEFSDLEDAIQYYTACEHNIPVVLTRNLKDYRKAEIVVQTPEEWLKTQGWV
ncbi:MAG: PIN domain-containing protein [Treponema sp.]|nr:PIN domain-containing protein [Treponema sp.]